MREQHESFAITQRGKVEGVLLNIEEYEGLIETLEILSDRELVESIERGMKDANEGKAIDSLAQNPYKGKPLSHELAGPYSYRTSDYRIIYKIEEGQLIIIVITVGHGREIYKKLKDWVS